MYRFISLRHLTISWIFQNEGIEFPFSSQHRIEEVFISASELVAKGKKTEITVAIPPPRGQPPKHASKILRSWYERVSQKKKKRTYACCLCGLSNHIARQCKLRHIFEEGIQDRKEDRGEKRMEIGS